MSSILRIGRDQTNEIIISDQTVSRNHGIITFETNGNVYFEDLNSSNGSFVNGNRIYGRIRLQDTDILKVGKALVPWHDYKHRFSGISSNHNNLNSERAYSNPASTPNNDPIPRSNDLAPRSSPFSGYLPVIIGGLLIVAVVIVLIMKSGGSGSGRSSDSNKDKNSEQKHVVNQPQDTDSDGDGIYDSKDNCPDEKGPTENNGCPFTDSDNDGTPDFKDECQYEWGPKNNAGCPIEEESNSFRTQCPYCNKITYQLSSNKVWECGKCGNDFFNCYRSSIGDHDGINIEWVGDGECDCDNCSDEN